MGRFGNALDWSEGTERASGIEPRALPVAFPERSDSEIRVREATPAFDLASDDDEPTAQFERSAVLRAPFLRDLGDVRSALEVLVTTARDACVAPGLESAIGTVQHAVGMWRTNVVRHMDDLSLGEDFARSASSSLPEYSAAYTLAIVQPALAEAEACAMVEDADRANLAPLIRAVEASVHRLNATLRYPTG